MSHRAIHCERCRAAVETWWHDDEKAWLCGECCSHADAYWAEAALREKEAER